MDPIHMLAMPERNSEALREDLYAMFAGDTVVERARRRRAAAKTTFGIRRAPRRTAAVALAH